MDIYRINPYLERAYKLISEGSDESLRYAALEFRFCFETIAYRQLAQYKEKHPGSIIGIWQPDQILKLLASFDPTSNLEGEISFAIQDELNGTPTNWMHIGSTKPIPWKAFRKLYNKLGSYLHVNNGCQHTLLKPESFKEIIECLENSKKATMIVAFNQTINATCECGQILYVGATEFDNDQLEVCRNTKCNSLWKKSRNDNGDAILEPVNTMTIKCACEAPVRIRLDRIWAPHRCRSCHATYHFNLAFSQMGVQADKAIQ